MKRLKWNFIDASIKTDKGERPCMIAQFENSPYWITPWESFANGMTVRDFQKAIREIGLFIPSSLVTVKYLYQGKRYTVTEPLIVEFGKGRIIDGRNFKDNAFWFRTFRPVGGIAWKWSRFDRGQFGRYFESDLDDDSFKWLFDTNLYDEDKILVGKERKSL